MFSMKATKCLFVGGVTQSNSNQSREIETPVKTNFDNLLIWSCQPTHFLRNFFFASNDDDDDDYDDGRPDQLCSVGGVDVKNDESDHGDVRRPQRSH